MIRIALVIPVFNGLDYTKKCLKSLYEQFDQLKDKAVFKVVVFNDGSTDGTSEWLNKSYPDVIQLHGDGQCWWSLSVNKSVEYILENDLADFILWWNNDVESACNYFSNLVEIASSMNHDTVIGSKIYEKSSGKVWGMGGQFNRFSGNKYQNAYFVENSEEWNKVLDVDWLPGMGTFAYKSAYEKVGLIDHEAFPQYHGDLDWSFSAKLKGLKVQVIPQLELYNNTENTGIKNKNSWKEMQMTMKSIKSLYNWNIDLKLYKKFTYVPFSYIALLTKYSKFIGGFLKWKLLNAVGISKAS